MPESPLDPLMQAVQAGDAGALDALVARCLPRLHAYVRLHMGATLRTREASLDVVQSICREALEERENFVYRGEGQMISWLLTTATNKLRERSRYLETQKRSPQRETPSDGLDPALLSSLVTPSRDAIQHEEIENLEKALARLPDDYREVIVLARIVELPHAEIAARMERTESSTRNLLGRALTQLTDEMQGAP